MPELTADGLARDQSVLHIGERVNRTRMTRIEVDGRRSFSGFIRDDPRLSASSAFY
jgi:hypothetical protein